MHRRDREPAEAEYYEAGDGKVHRILGKVRSNDQEYLAIHAFRRDGSKAASLWDNAISEIVAVDPETDEWCTVECEITH